jgi:hypothetical protein
MKTKNVCICAIVVLLVAADASKTLAQSENARQSDGNQSQSWKELSDVAMGTKDALDQSQQALERIERLRSLKTVPIQVALPTAQAAFVLRAPVKAIAIMERAIQEYPDEKMPGVTFPLDVVGNLWIGTFARYAGDPTRAEAAYRDVLSRLKASSNIRGPSVLAAVCYLYLAEIETHFRNRPDKAAALLKEIAVLPKTGDKQGDLVLSVYQAWGQHMLRTVAPQPPDDTSGLRVVQPPYGDPTFVPDLHMSVVGLGDPGGLGRLSAPAGSRSKADVFTCSLDRVLESKISPIDTALTQLLLGIHYDMDKKDSVKAMQYYGGLFNGGSYFAPEGGLAVSRCWKRENKLNEAKQTLEEVVRRFPAYKGKVKYLLQQLSLDSKRE